MRISPGLRPAHGPRHRALYGRAEWPPSAFLSPGCPRGPRWISRTPTNRGFPRLRWSQSCLVERVPPMPAPLPPNETERLDTLSRYDVLDTPPDAALDRLTALAARLFDVPIALVSLVDKDRQWFKSRHGLDVCETHRDQSFCAYAILPEVDEPMVVFDATLDPRFADNPLVTGAPGIRFYAGAPLRMSNGTALGSFCIIDTKPREFSAARPRHAARPRRHGRRHPRTARLPPPRPRGGRRTPVGRERPAQQRGPPAPHGRQHPGHALPVRAQPGRHVLFSLRRRGLPGILRRRAAGHLRPARTRARRAQRTGRGRVHGVAARIGPDARTLAAPSAPTARPTARRAGWRGFPGPRPIAGGKFLWHGMIIDVTARKQAERDAERAAERVRTVLESIGEAFFCLDRDWKFTYVNDHAVRVLKRTREELLGRSFWEEMPAALDNRFGAAYRARWKPASRVQVEDFSPRLQTWAEAHAYPSDEGLSIYFRDISDRKHAEADAERARRRVRTVLESITNAFYSLDRDWRFHLRQRSGRGTARTPPRGPARPTHLGGAAAQGRDGLFPALPSRRRDGRAGSIRDFFARAGKVVRRARLPFRGRALRLQPGNHRARQGAAPVRGQPQAAACHHRRHGQPHLHQGPREPLPAHQPRRGGHAGHDAGGDRGRRRLRVFPPESALRNREIDQESHPGERVRATNRPTSSTGSSTLSFPRRAPTAMPRATCWASSASRARSPSSAAPPSPCARPRRKPKRPTWPRANS